MVVRFYNSLAEHIFMMVQRLSEYIEGTTQDLFSDGNQDVTFNTVTTLTIH